MPVFWYLLEHYSCLDIVVNELLCQLFIQINTITLEPSRITWTQKKILLQPPKEGKFSLSLITVYGLIFKRFFKLFSNVSKT